MTKLKHLLLISIILFMSGCSNDAALKKRAYELAHKFIITDGHIDVPWRLNDGYEDLSVRTDFEVFEDLSKHDTDKYEYIFPNFELVK